MNNNLVLTEKKNFCSYFSRTLREYANTLRKYNWSSLSKESDMVTQVIINLEDHLYNNVLKDFESLSCIKDNTSCPDFENIREQISILKSKGIRPFLLSLYPEFLKKKKKVKRRMISKRRRPSVENPLTDLVNEAEELAVIDILNKQLNPSKLPIGYMTSYNGVIYKVYPSLFNVNGRTWKKS